MDLCTHVGPVIDNARRQKKRSRGCRFFGEVDQKSLVDPRNSDRLFGENFSGQLGEVLSHAPQDLCAGYAGGEKRLVVRNRYPGSSAFAGVNHADLTPKSGQIECSSQPRRTTTDDDAIKHGARHIARGLFETVRDNLGRARPKYRGRSAQTYEDIAVT